MLLRGQGRAGAAPVPLSAKPTASPCLKRPWASSRWRRRRRWRCRRAPTPTAPRSRRPRRRSPARPGPAGSLGRWPDHAGRLLGELAGALAGSPRWSRWAGPAPHQPPCADARQQLVGGRVEGFPPGTTSAPSLAKGRSSPSPAATARPPVRPAALSRALRSAICLRMSATSRSATSPAPSDMFRRCRQFLSVASSPTTRTESCRPSSLGRKSRADRPLPATMKSAVQPKAAVLVMGQAQPRRLVVGHSPAARACPRAGRPRRESRTRPRPRRRRPGLAQHLELLEARGHRPLAVLDRRSRTSARIASCCSSPTSRPSRCLSASRWASWRVSEWAISRKTVSIVPSAGSRTLVGRVGGAGEGGGDENRVDQLRGAGPPGRPGSRRRRLRPRRRRRLRVGAEPAEGTMLTVFREMAHSLTRQLAHLEADKQRLGRDVGEEQQDAILAEVLERAIEDGGWPVARTPSSRGAARVRGGRRRRGRPGPDSRRRRGRPARGRRRAAGECPTTRRRG